MKKRIIIIPLVIMMVVIVAIILMSNQPTGSDAEWKKSDISCNVITDCENYLNENGAPNNFLDSVILKCEDNLCLVKNK